MIQTLHPKMSTANANSMDWISILYHEFFIRKDYDWWRPVQPGDIVVDVGANIGLFTCSALDKGASKVYAIEPSLELLQTTMYNATPHIVDKLESPVIPINCAITHDKTTVTCIYGDGDKSEFKVKTFKQIIEEYGITKIDYLKIDCEGGEYSILNLENLDFIKNNVRHIAVEMHLNFHKDGPALYDTFRETFLPHFNDVRFMDSRGSYLTYEENKAGKPWPISGTDGWWMVYICNHDIP